MGRPNFAVRTIRDGKVRIFGRDFAPEQRHRPYDGRLDGMRYAFGLYYGPGDERLPHVALWGSEEAYKLAPHATEEEFAAVWNADPQIVDGFYPWHFWLATDALLEQRAKEDR